MNLNSLIPGIESFMEDVEITNNVTTGENEGTEAPAEETPAEAPAAEEQDQPEEAATENAEEAKPAEMKSSYFNW